MLLSACTAYLFRYDQLNVLIQNMTTYKRAYPHTGSAGNKRTNGHIPKLNEAKQTTGLY